jgi:pyruvate dehydrogenase E2 component (dihydrolipoamide acetyltransferase)
MQTGSIIQWHKKVGDPIEKGEPLLEILSDKITYDVEAPATGILRRVLADEGKDLPIGAVLGIVAGTDEKLLKTETNIAQTQSEPLEEPSNHKKLTQVRKSILASPAAKKIAKEHKIDLSQVKGTGPEGRIVRADIETYLEALVESRHVREEIPLTGIRKTVADRVSSSFQTAPHSFIIMDVDMSKATELKEKTKTSYTSILVQAAAQSLIKHPRANSALINKKIRVYKDINIGIAVSTSNGLLVPVIRNVDEKKLSEIASELEELAQKTRDGILTKEQLEGGTFTVTNLGMYDVNMFLPIINPPEAAILAAGNITDTPVVSNGKISVKPIMTLTLAYDHRILDGAPAASFLKEIKNTIEKPIA